MSINLGPLIVVPGIASIVRLTNISDIQAIKVSNGTPFDLSVSGFMSGTEIVPAGSEYFFHDTGNNQGQLNILPVNNVGLPGTGAVNVVAYQQNEQLPKGSWPLTIPTQIVQASTTSVPNLINDGNAAGTQFLESKVSGAPGSTWSFTNDGNNSFIAVLVSNVVDKLIQISNSGNFLKLGLAGNITEVLGQLTVDQLFTMASNGLTVPAATDAVYNVPTGQKHNFEVNAVSEVTMNASALISNVGVNTNTIRDNVNGNAAMDLSLGTGAVKFPLAIFENAAAFSTTNGSVSGTCTMWMPLQGTALKVVVVIYNNYQDASNRSIALPTAFTNNMAIIVPSDIGVSGNGGFQLLNNVTAQNITVLETISATGVGGTGGTFTTMFKFSFGSILAGSTTIDHINILSLTTAHNGIFLLIGS